MTSHAYSPQHPELRLQVVPASGTNGPAPALVYFFGSGWRAGTPEQLLPQARWFARLGVTGVLVDYRVASRHWSTIDDSLEDALTALTWVRDHADLLGIDLTRVGAVGSSAGGHLAACAALVEDGVVPAADGFTHRPDLLVLLNPVLCLGPPPGDPDGPTMHPRADVRGDLTDEQLRAISPEHLLTESSAHLPPTLVLHGRDDVVVPCAAVERFTATARRLGAPCTLLVEDDAGHGFFNPGRDDNRGYDLTVGAIERFLVAQRWVEGERGR